MYGSGQETLSSAHGRAVARRHLDDAVRAALVDQEVAVVGDVETAHRGAGGRQLDLGELERRRVDLHEAGRAVASDPEKIVGGELDAVGLDVRRLHGDELDVA